MILPIASLVQGRFTRDQLLSIVWILTSAAESSQIRTIKCVQKYTPAKCRGSSLEEAAGMCRTFPFFLKSQVSLRPKNSKQDSMVLPDTRKNCDRKLVLPGRNDAIVD